MAPADPSPDGAPDAPSDAPSDAPPADVAPPPEEEPRVTASVTMLGADRKGVVARVTQYLFEQGGNIESLEEQVSRGFFSMNLLASWAADGMDDARRDALVEGLEALGDALDMETRVRFHRPGMRQRMAVLVTKVPHCLEAVLDAHARDELGADVALVVGNYDDLAPIADEHGVPFVHLDWDDRDEAEARLIQLIDKHEIDLLVLARFMKILSPLFCWRYRNRIINIHPSLLPAFPGAQAYRQAWEKGVRVVGATAHFVTPDLDQGPIIHQEAFPVGFDESVEEIKAKGKEVEAKVLLEAIRIHLDKELDVHWGRVWMGEG